MLTSQGAYPVPNTLYIYVVSQLHVGTNMYLVEPVVVRDTRNSSPLYDAGT